MDGIIRPTQASVRAIHPTGVSGDIPVYREDWDTRIGNATFDKAIGIVEIEITDPETSAWLNQDNLLSFSLGSVAFDDTPKKDE